MNTFEEQEGGDTWIMLICTIRYSLGRTSYMPGECVNLYARYSKYLTTQQRKQIAEEIRDHLRRSSYTDPWDESIGRTWTTLARQIEEETS